LPRSLSESFDLDPVKLTIALLIGALAAAGRNHATMQLEPGSQHALGPRFAASAVLVSYSTLMWQSAR
jgi:hypothetical protein